MTQAEVIILYSYKCLKFMSLWCLNLSEGPPACGLTNAICSLNSEEFMSAMTLNLLTSPINLTSPVTSQHGEKRG